MKSQALAIALVVMCGVGTYIMFLSTLGALRTTQESYYRDYRFAELFVSLKRAQAIPGVDQVETRVAAQVRLDMPAFAEPVSALMVSVSEGGRQGLNALHIERGRLPAPERADEVAVTSSPRHRASRRATTPGWIRPSSPKGRSSSTSAPASLRETFLQFA